MKSCKKFIGATFLVGGLIVAFGGVGSDEYRDELKKNGMDISDQGTFSDSILLATGGIATAAIGALLLRKNKNR